MCAILSKGISLPTALLDYIIQEGLHLGDALTSHDSEGSDSSNNGCYLVLHYGDFGEVVNTFHASEDAVVRILRPMGEEPNVMDIAANLITSAASAATTAVDVGCGVGGLARRLSRSFSTVWGFDTDFDSVLTARCINLGTPTSVNYFLLRTEGRSYAQVNLNLEGLRENMEFVVADAGSPPFENKGFDAVACSNLVDVSKAPREVVSEVVGMMSDHGCVLFSSPWFWGVSGSFVEDWFVAKDAGSLPAFIDHLITDQELVVINKVEQVAWPLWIYKGHVRLFFDDLIVAQRNQAKD
jgi:SAM-dependent methyltransferase